MAADVKETIVDVSQKYECLNSALDNEQALI